MGEALDEWLDSEDDNLDRWTQGNVPAWERRVLATRWLAKAWENAFKGDEQDLGRNAINIQKIGQRTGLLMTADGSDDDKNKTPRFGGIQVRTCGRG
jgi:hypothetical protein